MKVLVLNAGSSTLKYQVIDMDNDEKVLAKGNCERIGIHGGIITHKVNGKKLEVNQEMKDHRDAIDFVLKILEDKEYGCLKNAKKEIGGVGHRVVQGGNAFKDAALVDKNVEKKVEDLIPLAPLHNPGALMGYRAAKIALKGIPNVMVFDTVFHQTMPDYVKYPAISKEVINKAELQNFGAHGINHQFVSSELATEKYFGKQGKFVILHSGSGASVSAVKNGICINTSMGQSPLAGLVMGTRSGTMEASMFVRMCEKMGWSMQQGLEFLNKKSGFFGITGEADARDVDAMYVNENQKYTSEQQAEAERALVTRVKRDAFYIGGYKTDLGGLDALAFTAGLGENDNLYRKLVCDALSEDMGIVLDENKNNTRGVDGLISAPESKVNVYVVPANEELQIARDVVRVLKNNKLI